MAKWQRCYSAQFVIQSRSSEKMAKSPADRAVEDDSCILSYLCLCISNVVVLITESHTLSLTPSLNCVSRLLYCSWVQSGLLQASSASSGPNLLTLYSKYLWQLRTAIYFTLSGFGCKSSAETCHSNMLAGSNCLEGWLLGWWINWWRRRIRQENQKMSQIHRHTLNYLYTLFSHKRNDVNM